ncbi:MAG TPA: hypothetical protein VNU65_12455 [Xanthobacteraceae bacterium]|jgi:hypothetical protein|nr:hypothetical protein [Xanthobacteraceae bacterium]
MSIGSVSLWQQDQNFWQQGRAQDQVLAAQSALISNMGAAITNRESGLSSIANQAALSRVNNQIAADEKALQTASASGSGSSGSSAPKGPAPATAIGTTPLTTSTPLSTLGIPPNGTITVSDGTNTTTYSSTGTDTIASLIGAINANVAGNAYVTASLNGKGNLVIIGKNQKESVIVGGTFASDVGFRPGNQTFQPTAGSPSSSSSSASSATSGASASTGATTSGSTGISTKTSKALQAVTNAETVTTAASLLAQSGVSGNLVDMLV